MERTVYVLVDYDNISDLDRARGIAYTVSRIVDALGARLTPGERVRLRLYGGWYYRHLPSRANQTVNADVTANFPRTTRVSGSAPPLQVSVAVELATSLMINPRRVLENTYRTRTVPQNIRCATPPFSGCANVGTCPIAGLHYLFDGATCPQNGCVVSRDDLLTRGEQKLVDTMLTTDLLYLATRNERSVSVVSSDDDMWPGIQAATSMGTEVLHIQTIPGRKTPRHYTRGVGKQYYELPW
jgi:hypothetical protein